MSNFIHRHIHHFHYTEINEIYISSSLRALAMGVVGIFVPIYLYSLGYALTIIALYFLALSFVRIFMEVLSGLTVAQIGPKHTMSISFVLFAVYLVGLILLPQYPNLLFFTASLYGVATSLHWMGRHADVSYIKSQKHGSSEVANTIILGKIAAALGPLAGGLIATNFGISYSLGLGVALFLLAIYPLFKTREAYQPKEFNWRELLLNFAWKDAVSYGAQQVDNSIIKLLWPLFIFLFLGSYQAIGFVLSLSLVLSIAAGYVVGKFGDQGDNPQLLSLGSAANSAINGLRVLVESFTSILGVNVLSDITYMFLAGPFTSIYYKHADNAEARLAYIVSMQTFADIIKAVFWLLIVMGSLILANELLLIGAFVVAAFASFIIPLITAEESTKLATQ